MKIKKRAGGIGMFAIKGIKGKIKGRQKYGDDDRKQGKVMQYISILKCNNVKISG